MSWLRAVGGGVRATVRVTPRAARSAVQGVAVDARGQAHLAVRVAAAPADGKANAALIELLTKRWRLPASALRLVSGGSGRRKVLHVAGAPQDLLAAIAAVELAHGGERR